MERLGLRSLGVKHLCGKVSLKRDLLYFDKIICDANDIEFGNMLGEPIAKVYLGEGSYKKVIKEKNDELDFLRKEELLETFDSNLLEKIAHKSSTNYFDNYKKQFPKTGDSSFFSHNDLLNLGSIVQDTQSLLLGESIAVDTIYKTYLQSALVSAYYGIDVVPIVEGFRPENTKDKGKEYQIIEVILSKFPVIDDNISWDAIIDFKSDPESKRKFLALRNWMIDISKSNYSISEIDEKLEYLLNEYTVHLEKHKIDTQVGFIKSFTITTLEVIENLAKLKLSKVAKTLFEINEQSSKLLEIDENAPGKEIAYIYNTHKKLK